MPRNTPYIFLCTSNCNHRRSLWYMYIDSCLHNFWCSYKYSHLCKQLYICQNSHLSILYCMHLRNLSCSHPCSHLCNHLRMLSYRCLYIFPYMLLCSWWNIRLCNCLCNQKYSCCHNCLYKS